MPLDAPATATPGTDTGAGTTATGEGTAGAASTVLTDGTQAKATDTTTQTSKAGEQTGEDGKAKPDDKVVTPPEKYELKAPEGMELDSAAVEEFNVWAKERKLSAADAQSAADIAIKMAQRQAEQTVATVKAWAEDCKNDKELGGDKFDENRGIAKSAVDTFGSPEFKAILNASGWGNHPEFMRFALKIGKALGDDSVLRNGQGADGSGDIPLAKRMYPNMN